MLQCGWALYNQLKARGENKRLTPRPPSTQSKKEFSSRWSSGSYEPGLSWPPQVYLSQVLVWLGSVGVGGGQHTLTGVRKCVCTWVGECSGAMRAGPGAHEPTTSGFGGAPTRHGFAPRGQQHSDGIAQARRRLQLLSF